MFLSSAMGSSKDHDSSEIAVTQTEQIQTSKQASFTMNHDKQAKTIKKNALLDSAFSVEINNYDQNVNILCNSGFFAKIVLPAMTSLANQCSDDDLTINQVSIKCTSNRSGLDHNNINYNSVQSYSLSSLAPPVGRVSLVTVVFSG